MVRLLPEGADKSYGNVEIGESSVMLHLRMAQNGHVDIIQVLRCSQA